MRIVLLPLKTSVREPEVNLGNLTRRLAGITVHRPDLVCQPECTLTGYLYTEADFERSAEPVPGSTVERMAQLAQQYGIYLLLAESPHGTDQVLVWEMQ